jgi:hypothetical protein
MSLEVYSMARKRQENLIRTDYLENWIGFYRAYGDKEKADALCKVARDIGSPIEADEVDSWQRLHTPG